MKEFLKSTLFRVILIVLAAVIVTTAVIGSMGGWSSPIGTALGGVVEPIQSGLAGIGRTVSRFFSAYGNYEQLERENAELREQLSEQRDKQLEYEQALRENEFYKDYLNIKENNTDFELCPASVVARDASDPYGSFTISSGSLDGISPHDPVITSDGLVGYVGTVAPTYSVVITLFDPTLKVGAADNRTGDSGIISSTADDVAKGVCRLERLSRDCSVAIGDYVVTTGGGVFPAGLTVGTVESLGQNEGEITVYVTVKPAADISKLSQVMVITSFTGQNQVG